MNRNMDPLLYQNVLCNSVLIVRLTLVVDAVIAVVQRTLDTRVILFLCYVYHGRTLFSLFTPIN